MPHRDAKKNERNVMPFINETSTELVMLEAKLNVHPKQGFQSVNVVIQKFVQHCRINQSSISCMIMDEKCVTVKFQVPTSSLPHLEKKIVDSEQYLANMKVSLVKILDKTVFEIDSEENIFSKVIIHLIMLC